MSMVIPLDEMVDGRGGVRPHWRRLLGVISDLGHRELLERRQQITLALADQTGSRVNRDAPLLDHDEAACDPIPLVLPAEEFATLEAGIIQRARLLEALLRDSYGPRELLREGILPPALLWANNGFMRSARANDRTTQPDRYLSFIALDMIREPDGAWRILADRTARANGVGLAIENRRQMARMVPELLAGSNLRHLAPFVDMLQDSLQRAAGPGIRNPSLALLTPGPNGPHWGEQVILARELGCTLAESGDLSVRNGALWLKTVRGLRQVDLLLVRQNSMEIDPLEQDGHGPGGIAGILDAARAGTVRLINDPRSGFAEAGGFAAFMPALSRRLLGENLLLEDVTTLWLGSDAAMQHFDALLAEKAGTGWTIASAINRNDPFQAIEALDKAQLDKIRQAPWRHILTRIAPPSVAPTIGETGIVPRPLVLRMFAAFDGEEWVVMPGGLARVFPDAATITAATTLSQMLGKDVWVGSDERVITRGGPMLASTPLPIRRAQADLPSRAADDFFWLGRYLEQIESAARALRVVLAHMSGPDASPRERAELDVLLRQLRAAGLIEEAPVSSYGLTLLVRELSVMASAEGVFARLLRKVTQLVPVLANRLTREMRDFILNGASDAQRALTACRVRGDANRTLDALSRLTDLLLAYGATISGFAAENMVRSGGHQFLDLGRRLERCSTVLLTCAGMLDQPGIWQRGRMESALRLMLELCDSVITYRARYFNVMQPAPVLDLLLLDEDNPRGAGFQFAALQESLTILAHRDGLQPRTEAADALITKACDTIETLTSLVAGLLRNPDQDRAASTLPEPLKAARASVLSLSDEIGRCYFAVLASSRVIDITSDMDQTETDTTFPAPMDEGDIAGGGT